MKTKKIHNIESTGFKTPSGYFDSLEKNILDKIDIENTSSIPKKTGFEVPDSYFNNLEDTIAEKVAGNKQVKIISLFSTKNLIYASSIAATIIILISLSIFRTQPSFDNLETETVENYIISESISSYEIASLLNDDELNEDEFVDLNLENENIEAYLLNNIDIEDLMIE
jgi:hypothetical protein